MGGAKALTAAIEQKMGSCSALSWGAGGGISKSAGPYSPPPKVLMQYICLHSTRLSRHFGRSARFGNWPPTFPQWLLNPPYNFLPYDQTSCLWPNISRRPSLASTCLWDHYLLQTRTPPRILNAHLKSFCSVLWSPFYVNKPLLGSMLKTAPKKM